MKAHWAYFKYVLRHKRFVYIAGRRLNLSLWRCLVHDLSKFLPCEWAPYVHSFFNSDGSSKKSKERSIKDKSDFDYAWLHHQKNNLHHWNAWVLVEDKGSRPLVVPDKYAREMVADWWAMSLAKGESSPREWFNANQAKMLLHPTTLQGLFSLILTETVR